MVVSSVFGISSRRLRAEGVFAVPSTGVKMWLSHVMNKGSYSVCKVLLHIDFVHRARHLVLLGRLELVLNVGMDEFVSLSVSLL